MLDGCSPASPPSRRAHWAWPVEADAGAGAVDLHPPGRRRRSRRRRPAVKNTGAPWGPSSTPSATPPDGRAGSGGGERRWDEVRTVADLEHVTRLERPSVVAAEAAEGERRPATQHDGHVDPAPHRNVGAQPGPGEPPEAQHRPRPGLERLPLGHGPAVELPDHLGAAEAHHGVAGEPKRRPVAVHFNPAASVGCRPPGRPAGTTGRPSARSAGRRPSRSRADRGGPAPW